jgi:hypothetical protein
MSFANKHEETSQKPGAAACLWLSRSRVISLSFGFWGALNPN